jgi:hypothetical protein
MSSQANVYSGAISNTKWYTDKASIATGTNSVTFQVNIANLANAGITSDTIYSNAVVIPANSTVEMFVGVGNYVTITLGNATIQELGTASSGANSVQANVRQPYTA